MGPTNSSAWESQGCEACRLAVLRAIGQPPLVRLGVAEGPTFLYRCTRCGAYWQESLREAHVIDQVAARHEFPEAAFDAPA